VGTSLLRYHTTTVFSLGWVSTRGVEAIEGTRVLPSALLVLSRWHNSFGLLPFTVHPVARRVGDVGCSELWRWEHPDIDLGITARFVACAVRACLRNSRKVDRFGLLLDSLGQSAASSRGVDTGQRMPADALSLGPRVCQPGRFLRARWMSYLSFRAERRRRLSARWFSLLDVPSVLRRPRWPVMCPDIRNHRERCAECHVSVRLNGTG
jgi:hypothetical protein